MSRTTTRTHVFVGFANPFLFCKKCGSWVTGWHDRDKCGCKDDCWNIPCGCRHAGVRGLCPSWSPVDGCTCGTPCALPQDNRPQKEDLR